MKATPEQLAEARKLAAEIRETMTDLLCRGVSLKELMVYQQILEDLEAELPKEAA